MEPKLFIGVDVSKLTLDFAIIAPQSPARCYRTRNTEPDIRDLLKSLKGEYHFKSREVIFCAENMGIYTNFLVNVLATKKIQIALESPLQIKKSLGITRGKSDKLDSVRIAQYAKKNYNTLRIWQPPRECVEKLKKLTTIKKRLLKVKKMLGNEEKLRLYFLSSKEVSTIKSYYERSSNSITQDLDLIEKEMNSIIFADERLSNLLNLITSVPGIGRVIALEIILSTNEFKNISSAKKYASYCGVAPFEWSSGTSISGKTRVSHFANKEIKAYLHLAAMSCLRQPNGQLHEYYLRKQKEGENNMSILNAVRNKLLHRIFACVRNNQTFHT